MTAGRPARPVAWLGLAVVAGVASALRYRFVEPPALADYCVSAGAAAPTWCWLREQVVLGFLYDVYGIAALAATALALAWRRGASAWLAAALGAFAVGLYCYQAGAFALLTGCLLLLRSRPAAARDEYRGGDEPMQAQP